MSDRHDRTRELVETHLRDLGATWRALDDGTIAVPAGSSTVIIDIEELGGRCIVLLSAEVVTDVDLTDKVRDGLLRANAGLRFGKFAWLGSDRVITVDYELLGDTLDRDELGFALERVSEIADNSDDELLARLWHGPS